MNNKIEIKITGDGTPAEIAGALRQIAQDLEEGNHINGLNDKGECQWEDSSLMTTISEVVD